MNPLASLRPLALFSLRTLLVSVTGLAIVGASGMVFAQEPAANATTPGAIVKVQAQSMSEKSSTKQNGAPVLPKEMMR